MIGPTLLFAVVVAMSGDPFPDAQDPGLVQDVPGDSGPVIAPEQPMPGDQWQDKVVSPKDLTPTGPHSAPVAPPRSAPAESTTVRSNTGPTPPPAAAKPATPKGTASIAGYHDSLWNDTRSFVQRQFTDERPLLEKGDGKWMIQDQCEGERASVIFRFSPDDRLNQVICKFKQGVENSQPDYPLYKKVRASLVKRFGEPTSTNESPAPDSPSQAVEWIGPTGRATLLFEQESSSVQLTVESIR